MDNIKNSCIYTEHFNNNNVNLIEYKTRQKRQRKK